MAPETQEQDKHANCSVLLCIGPLETGAFRGSGDGARLADDMQAVMSDQPVEAAHEGIHRGQGQGSPPPPVIPSWKSLGQEALSHRRETPEKCQGPPK